MVRASGKGVFAAPNLSVGKADIGKSG